MSGLFRYCLVCSQRLPRRVVRMPAIAAQRVANEQERKAKEKS